MLRWLNRPEHQSEESLQQDLKRIQRSVEEFIPTMAGGQQLNVVGACDNCGSLIWAPTSTQGASYTHCGRCSTGTGT